MQRRTALKTIAAMLMAPTVRLRQEVDREKILSAFCCDYESPRFDIESPFRVGLATYSTDACALVRTELVGCDEGAERRIPPVEEVFQKMWQPQCHWQDFVLEDWRNLKMYDTKYGICPECGDRRVSYGDEYPPYELMDSPWTNRVGYDIDDNTIRDTSCHACNGKQFKGPTVAKVCGLFFSYHSLKRIALIPELRVSVSPVMDSAIGEDRTAALLFQGDGFEGIACGIIPSFVNP